MTLYKLQVHGIVQGDCIEQGFSTLVYKGQPGRQRPAPRLPAFCGLTGPGRRVPPHLPLIQGCTASLGGAWGAPTRLSSPMEQQPPVPVVGGSSVPSRPRQQSHQETQQSHRRVTVGVGAVAVCPLCHCVWPSDPILTEHKQSPCRVGDPETKAPSSSEANPSPRPASLPPSPWFPAPAHPSPAPLLFCAQRPLFSFSCLSEVLFSHSFLPALIHPRPLHTHHLCLHLSGFCACVCQSETGFFGSFSCVLFPLSVGSHLCLTDFLPASVPSSLHSPLPFSY